MKEISIDRFKSFSPREYGGKLPKFHFNFLDVQPDYLNFPKKDCKIIAGMRGIIPLYDILSNPELSVMYRANLIFEHLNRFGQFIDRWGGMVELAGIVVRHLVENDSSFWGVYKEIILVEYVYDGCQAYPKWFKNEKYKIARKLYLIKKHPDFDRWDFIKSCVDSAPDVVEAVVLDIAEQIKEFLKQNGK